MDIASTPAAATTRRPNADARTGKGYQWLGMTPFILVHLACFGALWSGVTWQAVVVGIALYWIRMFGVTGGYHRYFSHRSFKTGRFFQFLLAFLAETSSQRGVLWWAAHHRHHHKFSDTPDDTHSPRQSGFWYAHLMWIFDHNEETNFAAVRDLAKYPELRWLDKYWLVPPILLGVATTLIWGWSGLFIGFCLSTVVLWHGTFTVNSLAHVIGRRRFDTTDDSKNSLFIALITMGEGWHNNHHHYMLSARQGFRWWEIDVTYYIIKALSWLGVVWAIRPPPVEVPAAAPTPEPAAPALALLPLPIPRPGDLSGDA